MNKLTDTSKMPWGKHQGTEMQDVPAYYLIWLYDNHKCSMDVRDYIEDNMDVLQQEIENA